MFRFFIRLFFYNEMQIGPAEHPVFLRASSPLNFEMNLMRSLIRPGHRNRLQRSVGLRANPSSASKPSIDGYAMAGWQQVTIKCCGIKANVKSNWRHEVGLW